MVLVSPSPHVSQLIICDPTCGFLGDTSVFGLMVLLSHILLCVFSSILEFLLCDHHLCNLYSPTTHLGPCVSLAILELLLGDHKLSNPELSCLTHNLISTITPYKSNITEGTSTCLCSPSSNVVKLLCSISHYVTSCKCNITRIHIPVCLYTVTNAAWGANFWTCCHFKNSLKTEASAYSFPKPSHPIRAKNGQIEK